MNFEDKILSNIFYDEEYALKILPYTKTEYFDDLYAPIFKEILKFFTTYSTVPTIDEIKIELDHEVGISDKQLKSFKEILNNIQRDTSDRNWLVKKTEEFYKERSLANAVIQGATILEKKESNKNNEILKLVENALSISFDSNVGHNYFNDSKTRFDLYHEKEDKIPTGIKSLDQITLGGFSRKSLNCVMAQSGSGKSQMLVSLACDAIRQGFNVLYISLEMAEIRIAERIDANLLNIPMTKLGEIDYETYESKLDKAKRACHGKLVIKEFPTASSNVLHFKNLLNELKLKSGFIPDLICVDYINLMTSSRYKAGLVNSYGMVKAISEELRGLAAETNTVILTATQTNRSGFGNSDVDVNEISDSIGLVFTLDMLFAIIRTDAMDADHQVMIKQLKNRYTDLNRRPFIQLGLDGDHMRFYDLDVEPYESDVATFIPNKKVVPEREEKIADNFTQKKKVSPKNDFSKFQF